jgi:hypothetical protein
MLTTSGDLNAEFLFHQCIFVNGDKRSFDKRLFIFITDCAPSVMPCSTVNPLSPVISGGNPILRAAAHD